eukprot:114030_1
MALFYLFVIVNFLFNNIKSNIFRFGNTQGSNMVLQQQPYKSQIWGFGDANARVHLELIHESNHTVVQSLDNITNNDNRWLIQLDPMITSNATYCIKVSCSASNETIQLNNILFGDVILCSGQSNMQFTVDSVINASTYVQEANNYPFIRVFTTQNNLMSSTPQTELPAIHQPWSVANNKSIGCGNWTCFSAVCWFTALNIYNKYKHPLGLISTTYSGSPIRCWMPYNSSTKCNEPDPTSKSANVSFEASYCWNAMIAPFLTTTIRTVLWYQGEQDTKQHPFDYQYATCFPIMIDQWRYYWNMHSNTDALFPFGFVQLSVFLDDTHNVTCNNNDSVSCVGAAVVRLGQLANYSYVPNERMINTYVATAIDLGDPYAPFRAPLGAVHPRYKVQIGERLANASFNVVYGEHAQYFGGPYAQKVTYDKVNKFVSIAFGNMGNEGILIKHNGGFEFYDANVGWFNSFEDIQANGIVGPQYRVQINIPTNMTHIVENITRIRYNHFDAPCLPYDGIYNCALYDKQHSLPVFPFSMLVY